MKRPPSRVPQHRKEGPGHGEGGPQVDRDLGVEVGHGRLLERTQQKAAGIAHHHVGRADVPLHALGECLHLGGVGEVGGQVQEAVPRRQRARDPHHARARRPQRLGRRRPDPAGRARHQGDAAGEGGHSEECPPCASRRNSTRVLESSRKMPRSALVTVREFCFSHAPHHHAEVGRLDHHAHAAGREARP